MNTGQTTLVISAFSLLSTLSLSVNSTLIRTNSSGLEMEATLDAVSVGQSALDEVLSKDFDEKTIDNVRAFSYNDITLPQNFGPDGGAEAITGNNGIDTSGTGSFQSKTKFDDVDDYNGYTRMAWNPRLGWFRVQVQVQYVNEDDPNTVVSSGTFFKRVTVTVSHPNMTKDNNDQVIPLVMRDISVYRRYF
jgi:hypothetical protein